MDIYRVSLIGHRDIDDYRELELSLNRIITKLLKEKQFVEFQIGRNGEFDIFSTSCIKRVKKKSDADNCSMTLVLPYPISNMDCFEKYYDSILMPESLKDVHFKAAITKRNERLVNNSDLLIAYVRRDTVGAARCLKMAENAKLDIIKI